MIASERSLWQWLTKDWKTVPRSELHCGRVENMAGSGMPDVEGCYRRRQFWIELKVAARPKKAGSRVDLSHLRPKQVEWLNNRWLAGGNAWVLVRVGDDALYMVPGEYALLMRTGVTEDWLEAYSVLQDRHARQRDVLLLASIQR